MSSASRMSKSMLLVFCVAVSVMAMIVANLITMKQVNCFGLAIDCGSFLIPVTYVIGDILTEVYGFKVTRDITILSLAMNVIAILFFELTLAAPAFWTFESQAAFETVLGNAPRMVVASATAFFVGSLTNAKIMEVMHARDGESKLAWRCIASTIVGEFLDALTFALVAFLGTLPIEVILQMPALATVIKAGVECILYVLVTGKLIRWAKKLPNESIVPEAE